MEWAENLLSTRRGTLLFGGAAALLAAILLIVYLKNYRSSVSGSNATVSVLVARNLIQKGAPGNIVASTRQYQVAPIHKTQLEIGAISDSSTLRGLVATHDIFPGQQLTLSDFVAAAPDALQTQLTGRFRAIQVPFDSPHGMVNQIQAGDHVDVYMFENVAGPGGTQNWLKQLMQNALVMRTPTTGAASGTVVLRGTAVQAAQMAFVADTGKLWLVLRPASGAKPVKPGLITVERLLLGARAVG
jgi:Flp pilus assembly protein CpaB